MKHLLSILLAFVLISSLSASAFAIQGGGGMQTGGGGGSFASVGSVHIMISSQPVDATGDIGAVVTFHVGVEIDTSFSTARARYNWQQVSGNNLVDAKTLSFCSGAETDTLSVTVSPELDGSVFRCEVFDENNNRLKSNEVKLKCTGKYAYKPARITLNPCDAVAFPGESQFFMVETEGDVVSYVWEYSGGSADSSGWGKFWLPASNIEGALGADSDFLLLPADFSLNGCSFRCRITDFETTHITDSAILTVFMF